MSPRVGGGLVGVVQGVGRRHTVDADDARLPHQQLARRQEDAVPQARRIDALVEQSHHQLGALGRRAGAQRLHHVDRVEAILGNPSIYELAALVPEPDRTRGGRRRHYPVFMWIVYEALLSVYESARQVEAELAHPVVWAFVRRLVRLDPKGKR